MESYDVVIIGAGLAGLQCAKLLGASGAKVLLVDRKSDLTDAIHTTGIFVRKTFEDFAFSPESLSKPIRNVSLYSPSLRPLQLESRNDEFRLGRMEKLYSAFLNDCVVAGVRFSGSTRMVSIELRNGESTVKLEKHGRTFDVNTKILVGADGANSTVTKYLGLDENREWIVGLEEVFALSVPDREPRLHCFLNSNLAPGYLAWVADDGHSMHIGVGGYPSRFKPREALKEFRLKLTGIVDTRDAELVETRGGRIPVGGILRNIANENGLLVGDAAGAVSPLTAGGLDPCMRLSAFAAEIILERLQADNPKALLQFSGKKFRSRFISRLCMRRAISFFTNQALLEIGCFFLRSTVGKKLAEHVFFGRGSFPDVEFKGIKTKYVIPEI